MPNNEQYDNQKFALEYFHLPKNEKYHSYGLGLVNLTSRTECIKASFIGDRKLIALEGSENIYFSAENDFLKHSALLANNKKELFDFVSGIEKFTFNDICIYINTVIKDLLEHELRKKYDNINTFNLSTEHLYSLFGNLSKLKNYSIHIKTTDLESDILDYLEKISRMLSNTISKLEEMIDIGKSQGAKNVASDVKKTMAYKNISSVGYFKSFDIEQYSEALFSELPKNKDIKGAEGEAKKELIEIKKIKELFEKNYQKIASSFYNEYSNEFNDVEPKNFHELVLLCAIYTACPHYMLNGYIFDISYTDFRNMISKHTIQDSSVSNLLMKSTQQANRWRSINKPADHTQRLINVLFHHFSQFKEDGVMRYEIIAWKKLVLRISDRQVANIFKKSN